MGKLVDQMLARKGLTRQDFAATSTVGKSFRKGGVRPTPCFHRIDQLPRLDWRQDIEFLVKALTDEYKRPGGEQSLLHVQAAALVAMHDFGGLFAPLGVGSGKTLTSFLLPRVVEAKRPLLLVPARLAKKTYKEWWQYSKNWILPQVKVVSYEKLGIAKNAELIDQLAPDLIIADEAHRLKNTKAAVTRRVARYLRHNECKVALMSGTMTVRSLKDFWHLLKWTHDEDTMPLPVEWSEMMEWAEALDVQSERATRNGPGVLANWTESAFPTIEEVRQGYQRRLTESPGVVATNTNDVDASLLIDWVDVNLDHMAEYYTQLRADWETPDGHPFEQASDLWRHARELVCGFYYVWDPRPPADWLEARREWSKFVRGILSHSQKYDSPFQVAKACHSGSLVSIEYGNWLEVRDTFKPNTVPRWVDDATLKLAAKWLDKEGGIVWTEHPPFAEKLSQMTGTKYFGRGAKSKDGTFMPEYKGPAIASVLTVGEGFNLQDSWNKSLVVSCPPNGKTAEQLLGRTHRRGQPKDEVYYTFVVGCHEQARGILQMQNDAAYQQQLLGQPQRMVYADKDLFDLDELMSWSGPRWQK